MGEENKVYADHWLVKTIHHWPTRIMCIGAVIVQAAALDYYLISHLGNRWFGVIAGDVMVICFFISAMVKARRNIMQEKRKGPDLRYEDSTVDHLTYTGWMWYAILLDVKIAVTFKHFASELKEHAFFGENTLKTAIAIDGIVFVTFLASQHNALPGSPRRAFITELTANVLFDVLDGVEALEILLDKEVEETLFKGLKNTIIGIVCITFLLPTIPMFTLALTRFGLKEIGEKWILIHRLALGYLINLPLFIIRMIIWHGMAEGVSIFALKNLIIMGVVTSEVIEKVFCKRPEPERHDNPMSETEHRPDNNTAVITPM